METTTDRNHILKSRPTDSSSDEEQALLSEEDLSLLATATPTDYAGKEDEIPEHVTEVESDQVTDVEGSYKQLFVDFFRYEGAPQLLIVTILLACGMGSVIGLVRK
jgi:hypothetical protein